MKILISTNAHFSKSGYAQQMAEFLPYLLDDGYEVAGSYFYGLEGSIMDMPIECPSGVVRAVKAYPKMAHTWGSDAMVHHSNDFEADVVITLQDIWVLNPNDLHALKQQGRKWVPIVPIDHEPTPPQIRDLLRHAYRIITYSKFGERQLKHEGFSSSYIPHTVNCDVFKPMDREPIRKEMGIPNDAYVFGMVSANKDMPPRKSFQEAMDAFARFAKKHPNSLMYFHAQMSPQGGFPISDYAKTIGIADKIRHTQEYQSAFKMEKKDMARLYNSFDCLLFPSLNEGFGVPIIEAQACGVPVIANDFTAMRDLVIDGKTGFKIKPLYKRFTPLKSFVGVPDTDDIYRKMKEVYKRNGKKMAKHCRQHILDEYNTKTVYDKNWRPFLKMLESEFGNA